MNYLISSSLICCIVVCINAINLDNCNDFNGELMKTLNNTHYAVCGSNNKPICYRQVENTFQPNEADAPVEKFDCNLYVETEESNVNKRNLGVFIKEDSFEWPKGVLCYKVSNSFNQEQKDFIQKAADKINAVSDQTGAKIITSDQCQEGMGVCDNCKHFVDVRPGEGCHSMIGMVKDPSKGYGQELSLDVNPKNSCFSNEEGTVMHEFGHALGLYHEHSHPKRTVIYLPQTLQVSPNEYKVSPDNYKVQNTDSARSTAYDMDSIMHYALYSQSNKNAGLCIPKDRTKKYCGVSQNEPNCVIATVDDCDLTAGKNIGRKKELSKGDIEALRAIYKGKGGGVIKTTEAPELKSRRLKTEAPKTEVPEVKVDPTSMPTSSPTNPPVANKCAPKRRRMRSI